MITTSVYGASGYSGAELLRILSGRSDVAILHAAAKSSAGLRVADVYPSLEGICDLVYETPEQAIIDPVDVAFIALPSGEAMNLVPRLLDSTRHIIDLGGDFRLRSAAQYEKFYGHPHTSAHLLEQAVYGLPELNRAEISGGRLIANPGCYPTSIILALLPALTGGMIASDGIAITSLSGITGAGRSSSVELSFSEINENIRAYKIGSHQHIPEIQTVLEKASALPVSFSFIPHLVPMNRGIYSTIHARLLHEVDESAVRRHYAEYYRDQPFVRIRKEIPQVRHVVNTNFCDIGVNVLPETHQLVICSTIDNLLKGAAGQAVQNMNILYELPQELGLLGKELVHVS